MVTSKRILFAFLLVFALALAGCTGTSEETRQAPTDEGAANTQLEESPTAKSDDVTDDDDDDADDDDDEVEASATEAKESKAGGISEDQALDIALKHAGIAKKDTSNVKVNREMDDGIDKYEIEFHVGNKEYSYDINAKTGDILESDSEVDDDND